MAVWGSNFVVIHIGLEHLPPLMFAALRFAAALFPAVLFIRRPAVPWRNLAAYGVFIGAGQFGILYIAMNGQITPALASLVVQMQVFFTMALAAYQNGERVRPFQWLAVSISVAGLALIMLHTDASTTPLGLALVLVAALCWAAGNMIIRSTPDADMLGYVVWASLFSIPPLLAGSFLLEGWTAIAHGFAHADWTTAAAVRVAGGRQHAVRLRRVGLAAVALSGRRHRADVAAGAGVRHRRFGAVARRAAAELEAAGDGARAHRPVHQSHVAEDGRSAPCQGRRARRLVVKGRLSTGAG